MAISPGIEFGATVRNLAAGVEVFDRFQLRRLVGRGGMGMVWLAHDSSLEIEVALKFLPEAVGLDEAAVADLARETRRARELAHHHIVRVYDFHRDDRMAAISMEYVDGPTLTGLRLSQPESVFEPAQLTRWVKQLCEALDYAHQLARVVHRDLKPTNLLVNSRGELKISDFGISASVSDSVTRLSRIVSSSGSPPYMSPQQMMGGAPSPSDDVYSLGATLFELLTGRPPFYSGNIPLQVQSIVPPSLAERRRELGATPGVIPTSWERTIASCLSKDPGARPESAGDVCRQLTADAPLAPPVRVAPAPLPLAEAAPKPLEAPFARPRNEGTAQPVEIPDVRSHGPAQERNELESAAAVSGTDQGHVGNQHGAGEQPAVTGRKRRWAMALSSVLGCAAAAAAIVWVWVPWQESSSAFGIPDTEIESTRSAGAPPQTLETPVSEADLPVPQKTGVIARPFTLRIDPADAPGLRVWIGQFDGMEPEDGVVRLPDLPDGDHEVVVHGEGYQPVVTRIRVADGDREQEIRLVPIRGRLEITTTPGARAVVRDDSGRETPVGVADARGQLVSDNSLRIGRYTLLLEGENRISAELPIEIAVGRPARVRHVLEPEPGQVRVISVPSGAEVLLDGERRGTTPTTIGDLPVGRPLRIQVSHTGYRSSQMELSLDPGEIRTLNVGTLEAESGAIEFALAGAKDGTPDFEALLDGRPVRPSWTGSAWRVEGVELGERRLELRRRDHQPWTGRAEVRDGETAFVEAAVAPLPAEVLLDVTGVPAFEVLVDGRAAELADGRVSLPPGRDVWVTVRAPGATDVSRRFTLAPNRRETWEVAMEMPRPETGRAWTVPELGLVMAWIAPGEFTMGSPDEEAGRDEDESPRTLVRIAEGFWLGKGEVTQGEWGTIMGDNPSAFTRAGSRAPVEQVSWTEAVEFCRRLTERERSAGRLAEGWTYALPTEAQWEFACRAGEMTPFSFGDSLASTQANFDGSKPYGPNAASGMNRRTTVPTGSFSANAFGLYDMHGNVWEWCADPYSERLPPGGLEPAAAMADAAYRVARGGGWASEGALCRSANRLMFLRHHSWNDLGFRVALRQEQ